MSVCAATDQLEAVRFGIDRRATDELDRFEANSASNRERMPIFKPINPNCSSVLLKTFLFNLFRLPASSRLAAETVQIVTDYNRLR